MAVTKIWKINGWLGHAEIYIQNPEKTTNPLVAKGEKLERKEYQSLADVINYATNEDKTIYEGQECFVSGVNCSPHTARNEMIATKKAFGKDDGICSYHCYQSFKPGEVTPQLAHEIGIKLAERMWGDNFQIIIATHLDHEHIHNHLLVNSVSFIDGHRFWEEKNYWKLRYTSDEICKEYGLSIIGDPQKGKSYSEWQDEKDGKSTWRSILRDDIDTVIQECFSLNELFVKLRSKGYEVKTDVKHLAVKPPGAERFLRLKSLGQNYTEEEILRRIIYGEKKDKVKVQKNVYCVINPSWKKNKVKGIKALYYRYLYLLGYLPKSRPHKPSSVLFKHESRKLDSYIRLFEFIRKHHINNLDELFEARNSIVSQVRELSLQRDELRKLLRKGNNEQALKEIQIINEKLKGLRSEEKICISILDRQEKMIANITTVQSINKNERTDIENGRRTNYQIIH